MNKFLAGCLMTLVICLFGTFEASALTNALSSCSEADVKAAIASASDGDTIICPAGTWSWSNVDINNKNITLQGAGIGNTIISITASGGIEAPASNTRAFRITGFTFISTGNFSGTNGIMRIQGGQGWRIDHNEFQIYSNSTSGSGGTGIYTRNAVGGLIDHNRFVNHPSQLTSGGCIHASVYPGGASATDWTLPSQLNSATRTVFVEDNYFKETKQCSSHNAHAVYGQFGGIYVARHNQIWNMNIDSHGFCQGISTREYEISNNEWIQDGQNLYAAIHPRGGTGVIYNNTITEINGGSVTYGVQLEEYRIGRNSACSSTLYHDGIQASSACGSNEGWPCQDQIGRGRNQANDPLYIWNNTNWSPLLNQGSSFIQANRDFFTTGAKPGYVGYPYPHPLTGAPCRENCTGGQPPPPPPPEAVSPEPPSDIQVR